MQEDSCLVYVADIVSRVWQELLNPLSSGFAIRRCFSVQDLTCGLIEVAIRKCTCIAEAMVLQAITAGPDLAAWELF